MKKHLITGASGFLGSAIVKKLVKQGEKVVSLDIIEDKEISKISEFYKIDVSNISQDYKKIFKDVDFVHHNAALVPLTKAGIDFFKANVNGTKNILEQSIKYNVGHFSVKPDFEKLKSMKEESIMEYILTLIYESTEILSGKNKTLGNFDTDRFRSDFIKACKELGCQIEQNN